MRVGFFLLREPDGLPRGFTWSGSSTKWNLGSSRKGKPGVLLLISNSCSWSCRAFEACGWGRKRAPLDDIVASFDVPPSIGYAWGSERYCCIAGEISTLGAYCITWVSQLTGRKSPMPLNVFQLSCMIVFDELLRMISARKSHSCLNWLCIRRKGFIVSYLNDFNNSLNLSLNLPNCIKGNLISQMPEQCLFTLLWLLNLSFFTGNQIVVVLIL